MRNIKEGYKTISEKRYEGQFVIVKYFDKDLQIDLEKPFRSDAEADKFINSL